MDWTYQLRLGPDPPDPPDEDDINESPEYDPPPKGEPPVTPR